MSSSHVEVTYSLTEFADILGTYPQYALSIVQRYGLFGHKERPLIFTEEDVLKARLFQRYCMWGLNPDRSANLVKYGLKDNANVTDIIKKVLKVTSGISLTDWEEFIEVLCDISNLEDDERTMLIRVLGKREGILKATLEAGLLNESQGKKTLKEAYSKIGFYLLIIINQYVESSG